MKIFLFFKISILALIDVILKNKPKSFHQTILIQASMSDCQRLILSFFKYFFKQFLAKSTEYHNYSEFSVEIFLDNLDQELNSKNYNLFSDIFRTILDHHALLKIRKITGSQAKFMTKK